MFQHTCHHPHPQHHSLPQCQAPSNTAMDWATCHLLWPSDETKQVNARLKLMKTTQIHSCCMTHTLQVLSPHILYTEILISGHLSSLTLHTAVLSTHHSLLGSHLNGQATLYLCQKHLLWWEDTVYPHVMLGHIIKPLGQSIYQGRLHMKLHTTPLFGSNWIIWQSFRKEDKMAGTAYAVLPSLTACLFICMLRGTKWTVQKDTLHHLTL